MVVELVVDKYNIKLADCFALGSNYYSARVLFETLF